MKILLLGNGFDLEHGLPTSYGDFLNFANYFLKMIDKSETELKSTVFTEGASIKKHVISIINCNDKIDIKQKLLVCLKDNCWIHYFNNNKNYIKENWIDFEKEIAKVIQLLAKAKKDYFDVATIDTIQIECPSYLSQIINEFEVKGKARIIKITGEAFIWLEKQLIVDLNHLISGLGIYLSDYVETMSIECFNPNIIELHPDKVLNFNYTNTYEKIYSIQKPHIEYDYIHGKAKFFAQDQLNNMVLGIDEYLIGSERDNDTDYIAFKKYFQRIQKMTGSEYKN